MEKKIKKLDLNELTIKSFVTEIKNNYTPKFKGGNTAPTDCGSCFTNPCCY